MSAFSTSRELAKGRDDDGTIPCPLPSSQTSYGELERLAAACDAGRRSPIPRAGPLASLPKDAAGSAAAGFLGYPIEPIDDVLVDAQYD